MKTKKALFVDVPTLESIRSKLSSLAISSEEIRYLTTFLSKMISCELLLNCVFALKKWDKASSDLQNWRALFANIPGFNFAGSCYILDGDSSDLLKRGVVMILIFAPSLSYNSMPSNNGYELWFYDSGTAKFWFPTFEDAEQYPELYSFRGTWKEAHYLLIETLKKGWPMEEFPEQLLPLLKK